MVLVADMALVGELLLYGLTNEFVILFILAAVLVVVVNGAVNDPLCEGEVVRFLDDDDDDDDDDDGGGGGRKVVGMVGLTEEPVLSSLLLF